MDIYLYGLHSYKFSGIDCIYRSVAVSSTHYLYGLFNSHLSAPHHTWVNGLREVKQIAQGSKLLSTKAGNHSQTLDWLQSSQSSYGPPHHAMSPGPKGCSITATSQIHSPVANANIMSYPTVPAHHKAALLGKETPCNFLSQTKWLWVTDG